MPKDTKRKAPSKAAKELEKQLARYRSMRDFQITAEPRGKEAARTYSKGSLPFVVQKHAATRLHYDFRLAWNGVLKSWAVTKGPSYYPADKRLAVQVEDHPIEYGDFEGTIPKGQYGGGTVMVWDYGTWEPIGNADAGLAEGNLKFILDGKKLRGRWVLVRMRNRDARDGKPNWLLIKERDEFASDEKDEPVTEREPDSAVSSRAMEQIASDNDRTWQSNRAPDQQAIAKSAPAKSHPVPSQKAISFPSLKSVPKEAFPGFIEPQLARATTAPPDGKEWIHELKLDGYRIQIQIQNNKNPLKQATRVALLTRKGLDWTHRMPSIADAATRLPVESAIIDGEAVVLDEKGSTSFADLQAAFQNGANGRLTYFTFDLLYLNGHNLRGLPLLERKKFLARLLAGLGDDSVIRLSEHFEGNGREIFSKACALGAEGIVSKVASSPYASDRGNAWLKSKCTQEQEFVIGGFTEPSKGGLGIGAILIGYYDKGSLRYAGRSGTGFTEKTQRMLRKQLDQLTQSKPPFSDLPKGVSRGVHWVRPELVAQISFATWTRDNLVRQAAFKGLREDKPAKEVVREMAVTLEATEAKHASPGQARPRRTSSSKTPTSAMNFPLTHPEKILDPESAMTKRDLASYLWEVAPHMLPHIANRPLSIVRCPEGIGKPCFFQKHIGLGLPEGIDSIPVTSKKTGKKEDYLTLSTAEGLAGMAQMGVLEIHPWGSHNDSLDKPDRIIFDLDPDEAIDWKTLAEAAKDLRKSLDDLGLESYLKTTGGKGLHVVVPILPEHDWPVIKQFTHEVVLAMEKTRPDQYVTKMTKALRKNRIYLDYLRNDRDATAIGPFSPRARPGAPVALPLDWKELNVKTRPVFHVSDLDKWRNRLKRDPWVSMSKSRQRLTASMLQSVRA